MHVLLGLAPVDRPKPVFWHVAVTLTVFSLSVYAISRTAGRYESGITFEELQSAVAKLL